MRLRSSKQTRRRRLSQIEAPKPGFADKPRKTPEAPPPARQTASPHLIGSWWQRLGLIILSAAILVSAVNALSLSTDAKVVPLDGSAKQLMRPMVVYQAAANRQLGKSVWSRNKITVNTSSLSQALLKQFPELSSASVTIPLLAHRPVVYIATSQPVLILVTDNGSFVVGSTGRALIGGSSPASLNQPNLPQLTDQSGLHIQTGQQALPAANVGFIRVVLAQLAVKQVAVSGMVLPAAASELDIHLKGEPYFVKFNLENDQPREQVGTYLATTAQLKHQNIKPSQYIDVRVPGRAYYK